MFVMAIRFTVMLSCNFLMMKKIRRLVVQSFHFNEGICLYFIPYCGSIAVA
jgi:hypothetical protein